MPQVPADKPFFSLDTGFISESSPLNFPDGSTLDESNFEILNDGSRKRRRGLDLEDGGSVVTLPDSIGTSDILNAGRWRNVGGDPSLNFVVVQAGANLVIFQDSGTVISTSEFSEEIELEALGAPNATASEIKQNPVALTFGRGKLFVSGKFVKPHYITYDPSGPSFLATEIRILERDFEGVNDGVANTTQPNAATTAHLYNLYNRGWKPGDITSFNSDVGDYPSKNLIWHEGYQRAITTNKAEVDGVWEWNSTKANAQLTGNASAPQGSLIRDPFDTTQATSSTSGAQSIGAISNGTTLPSTTLALTITVTGHGYSNSDEVVINDHQAKVKFSSGGATLNITFDGTYTVSGVTSNTFDITYTSLWSIDSIVDIDFRLGYVGEGLVERPSGIQNGSFFIEERPEAIQWFAGRMFYSGIDHSELNDHVFFSRIAFTDEDYGLCLQFNDPTNKNLSELLSDDGGVIVIPELGKVQRMIPYGASLLLLTSNGVWEIGGGQRGYFTADGYSVSKISDIECTSTYSPVLVEDSIFFTGDKGIYTIYRDVQTRQLVVQSVTTSTIQSAYNSIGATAQSTIKTCYDDARKRLYFLYKSGSTNTNAYTKALVLVLGNGAWYKLDFPTGIGGVYAIRDADTSDSQKKVKFLVRQSSGATLEWCDMDQSDYTDFDDTESVPYILTGYDNLQDFQRYRQAPIIHVFMKKTETGYTESGGDLIPVNESSLTMQARWDWADDTNSGKYGTAQQVYRHKRYYQPSGASDTFDDGQPVIVTRNKVRGRGRALHLYFLGEATKDAHLLGFAIHYMGNRRL